jgi:hypothetical protein
LLKGSCSHCGKQGDDLLELLELKRCVTCKKVWYCGPESAVPDAGAATNVNGGTGAGESAEPDAGAATNSNGGTGAGEGEAEAIAQRLATLLLKDSCAHCGKQGDDLKRCVTCKKVWYCGKECQQAGWKGHKRACAILAVPVHQVLRNAEAAYGAQDWPGVLKWEGRLEELLAPMPDTDCEHILSMFSAAHQLQMGASATMGTVHAPAIVRLETWRVELLGKMQRFRDQGNVMCGIASACRCESYASKPELGGCEQNREAASWFHRARKVAEAHGFFSVECTASMGLGDLAMNEGRNEEGVALLQNALVHPKP